MLKISIFQGDFFSISKFSQTRLLIYFLCRNDVSLHEMAKNDFILFNFACMGDFFTAALKPAFSDILAALF